MKVIITKTWIENKPYTVGVFDSVETLREVYKDSKLMIIYLEQTLNEVYSDEPDSPYEESQWEWRYLSNGEIIEYADEPLT